ncbi:MAG TPA: translation initiation factor IF-2 [Candidatus Paceibacterota bacterium]|nr:translation initiation factor IF-2 [Candidatus Paceibacterota bacterium]
MALSPRAPIVAVMGHIDHGKSSLLDYIRKANVTASEAGGITQHVSAYEAVHEHEGVERTITFLDTPGHEAFRALRSRGAAAADIAILVVAADEGVKPQTLEAYNSIQESNIPFVIAFTKMDKNGADIARAQASVLENGIYLEGLGGDIPYAPVSSKSGEGVPELLDLVLLTADLAELTADPELPASGFVLESSQDPKRGIVATLIVKDGSFATGTYAVAGSAMTPVRFIENFTGARIEKAGPSQPIRIAGWNSLPPAGTPFTSAATKKEAEKLASEPEVLRTVADEPLGDRASFPIIIKADVTGSIEAIKHELQKVTHERAIIRIVGEGVGAVSENDIKQAAAGGATIIAFTVGTESSARDLAERMNVPVESFSIIYDLENRVAELLAARAPSITVEEPTGEAKILKIFSTTGNKRVLGANLLSGTIALGDSVKLSRRGIELGYGKVVNLQQARADVKEIRTEGEFGAQVETKEDIAAGDTIVPFKSVTK